MNTRMVAAKTRYEPQAMWGTKSKTSIRKERRHVRKVIMPKMKTISRYREECEGACTWATMAMTNMTKVKKQAMG